MMSLYSLPGGLRQRYTVSVQVGLSSGLLHDKVQYLWDLPFLTGFLCVGSSVYFCFWNGHRENVYLLSILY